MRRAVVAIVFLGVAALTSLFFTQRRSSIVSDDAKAAGKTVTDFPESDSLAFDAMDGGITLSGDETKGRNTWLLWTAGDQAFWDRMAQHGYGTADLLKTIDSRNRGHRFKDMGLINQPGLKQAAVPDQYGLWLDVGAAENGVELSGYGRPSGIVGLRIYPNPKFDSEARKRWDVSRYRSDPHYYNDPSLARPYIVGMSCGF